jgi:hypothetical protein
MHKLKRFISALLEIVSQVWRFPLSVLVAIRGRREQVADNALNVERLDRIRNPSKYLDRVNETIPPK